MNTAPAIAPENVQSRGFVDFVLRPAVGLMNRLRYVPKFIIIGLFLLAPVVFISYLQFTSTTKDIVFNAKEIDGIEYIEPTRDFLHQVEIHRMLAVATMSPDPAVRDRFRKEYEQSATLADAAEKAVDAIDATHGVELQTTKRWGEIKQAWHTVKAAKFATAEEADKAHSGLTAMAVDLILNYAGNYSNLILDPDLDSYWLMDAFVVKLPSIGEAVSNAASLALRPAATGDQVGAADRSLELAGLYKISSQTVTDLKDVNIATVFKEAPNFSKSETVKNLKDPTTETHHKITGFAESVRRGFISASAVPPSAEVQRFVSEAIDTLNQNYKFYAAVGPELQKMAQLRVDKYSNQRRFGLAAALSVAIILFYLFFGFYLSIRESVDTLGTATARMIKGTTERFQLATKDELALVADSYNQINAALLEARTLRERIERDNTELQENIMDLLQVVARASEGDLTARATITAGALGNVADAFNVLMESLQNLVGEIQSQFQKTNQAVEAINTASAKISEGADVQAREVLSATKLVEGMNLEITKVSSDATNATDAAKRTEQSALEGAEVVQNVVNGMVNLRASVQSGAKKIKNLGDRSMEITSIVGTISRISEQTNMLALNAAIEAARAGEYGRGFSVVAEEVRKLAERTASATQEIDKLVKTIHFETNETVSAIEQQTQVVEEESTLVGHAGESLDRIRHVSAESASLVEEISRVSKEQAQGTNVVVKAMSEISAIAQATQRGAQSTVSTVSDLIKLARQTEQSIGRFKVS